MGQWMCTVQLDNMTNTSAKADLEYAIDDMKGQLNDDSDVSTDFYTYHSDYLVETDPCSSCYSEAEYVRRCLEELWDAGKTIDGDSWIIVDGAEAYGYGMGNVYWEAPDGQRLWGARVLHTPSQSLVGDPVETFYNLAIQEMGHSFSADHKDGHYYISSGTAYYVRPMSTAYAYISDDDTLRDTCYDGSGTLPSNFDCGPENGSGEQWCAGCGDACRHSIYMTTCTKSAIDSGTPK